ncbi:mannose-6-phosphate isomerase, class I [Caldibacillus debilis]|uniref:mannose-6-phosphate isomerase, class I n=1 Tax=Caldibacillus debilis TaxID=301148 RepID=UPI00036DCF56|nr:mannose-6-phosphate isomerase, class I [Caldibacillus debilis]
MMEPIFLQPVFKERIWGGTALRDRFGYAIPSDHTGECWAISGHPHGQSTVLNGEYKGMGLGDLWKKHRKELFGDDQNEVFPLLTKILDANSDLSVQVHPDDEYAGIHENGELGKTECWYIIDCKPGAELVYGHHAKTKEELDYMIKNGEWDRLLRRVPIRPGDFLFVPSGTIHALCEGTLVLETQQSSDTTYRVYDYDRTDEKGNKRELHLDKALDVITVPHRDHDLHFEKEAHEGAAITCFIRSEYFSVYKWEISGEGEFPKTAPYLLVSVIGGSGSVTVGDKSFPLKKGDHFILPNPVQSFRTEGKMEWIVSHP